MSNMGVTYKTHDFCSDELTAACDLVNQGGQLSIVLSEQRLREVYFVVIALSQTKVVGVSCIKTNKKVAEIGYTAVCASYRRRGVGQSMTKLLIDHALKKKITSLAAIVYKANTANRAKLEKMGLFKVSEFLSRSGEKTLCWYCHPLAQSKSIAKMEMRNFIIERQGNKVA